jgi:2-oxoglutarate dehydrogenase E1 component
MQVCDVTTPAQFFHLLRRQALRSWRKPLVVMSPKSLLRHKRCVSDLADPAEGSSFHRVLRDDAETRKGDAVKLAKDAKIRRVILCSGKVYYDLYEEREKRGMDDVYLLRVEQLYPFPMKSVATELSRFRKADVVWCQEEPKNMGSWTFVEPYLEWALQQVGASSTRARYAGRPAAASTAVGQMSKHLEQVNAFLNDVFAA